MKKPILPKRGDYFHIEYCMIGNSRQWNGVPAKIKKWTGAVSRVTEDSYVILDMTRVEHLEIKYVFGKWQAIDNYFKEPTVLRNISDETRSAIRELMKL